jgi:hypothetical protein
VAESVPLPGQAGPVTVTQSLVDIGDAQLHLESAGQGMPPVVVDTGHGGLSLGWRNSATSFVPKGPSTCTTGPDTASARRPPGRLMQQRQPTA